MEMQMTHEHYVRKFISIILCRYSENISEAAAIAGYVYYSK